jgi:hypothetical protein
VLGAPGLLNLGESPREEDDPCFDVIGWLFQRLGRPAGHDDEETKGGLDEVGSLAQRQSPSSELFARAGKECWLNVTTDLIRWLAQLSESASSISSASTRSVKYSANGDMVSFWFCLLVLCLGGL